MEINNTDAELKNQLFKTRISGWLSLDNKEQKVMEKYCTDYMTFLAGSKTERLCIRNIIRILEANQFKNLNDVSALEPGDRIYKLWKNKMVIASVIGTDHSQFRLIGSHVDSPRLDLKPNPLYEKANLALFKSHYYGGIKKYQWVNLQLSLHGVVFLQDGRRVEIAIGEEPGEPRFIIPDLLPHLSRDQMEKKGAKLITGEDLNVLVGSIPLGNSRLKDQIKLNIMKRLNSSCGINEDDFNFAELEFVPAGRPVEIGFDRSLIAGYGHDDRSCVYAALAAVIKRRKPPVTSVAMFVDKEEIGSHGNTGANSQLLQNFTEDLLLLKDAGIKACKILEASKAISGDVSPARNPNFDEVYDPENISYPGYGVTLDKYNGSKGKYGTNDSHAEYMQEIREILVQNKIPWQIGELGKVDQGGGGTIALFLTKYGMDCIDAGPSVLGMHSPCEVVSKVDIYATFKLYDAFLRG